MIERALTTFLRDRIEVYPDRGLAALHLENGGPFDADRIMVNACRHHIGESSSKSLLLDSSYVVLSCLAHVKDKSDNSLEEASSSFEEIISAAAQSVTKKPAVGFGGHAN